MSAAMEASLEGIKSIGFSYLDYSFEADFTASKHYAAIIIDLMLNQNSIPALLLNVNIPKLKIEDIKGLKVCEQGHGIWHEEFMESFDPRGEKYYWLTGRFNSDTDNTNSDVHALEDGYVSIVPSQHDLTNYPAIKEIKHFENL
jgi:5'-nucleotidase